MLNDDDRHIPVKLCAGGKARFAKGGLAHAANAVAGAGRFGDEMVVHINRREFEELRQKWGEPHINPDTGLPEFWDLGDLWDDVKDFVAPVAGAAAGAFLPGIGSALGSALPGLGSLLGSTGTQALASGLLGAGVGALTNGGKGALYGGLGGIAGAYGGDLFRNGSASALGGALSGGTKGLTDILSGTAADIGAAGVPGGRAGGTTTGGLNTNALVPALLMAGLNLGGSALSGGNQQKLPKGEFKGADEEFNKPLPVYENKRRRNYYTDVPDYTTQGERSYFANNGFAEGGAVGDGGPDGYVENNTGDHGRSDKIDALLSPNEYVIDAETVALLGNGSPEAGAEQLDRLRANIRAHKGSALAAGAISPDALPVEQYL